MAILKSTDELMEKFDSLYKKMSVSNNVEFMQLFGRVMREAIQELASTRPERADELIDELCAINWRNYLTRREAEEIVSGMNPSAVWTRDQLARVLKAEGLPTEEEPYYNEYALWVEVSKVYSDNHKTITELLGKNKNSVSESDMVEACYKLALNNLKDLDGIYNIRKYFGR